MFNISYFETIHSFTFLKFPHSIMFLVKLYDKFHRNPIHLTSNRSTNRQIEDRLKQFQKSLSQFRLKVLNRLNSNYLYIGLLLNKIWEQPLIIKELTKQFSISLKHLIYLPFIYLIYLPFQIYIIVLNLSFLLTNFNYVTHQQTIFITIPFLTVIVDMGE